jgi:hypothetical protein
MPATSLGPATESRPIDILGEALIATVLALVVGKGGLLFD